MSYYSAQCQRPGKECCYHTVDSTPRATKVCCWCGKVEYADGHGPYKPGTFQSPLTSNGITWTYNSPLTNSTPTVPWNTVQFNHSASNVTIVQWCGSCANYASNCICKKSV